MKINKKWIDEYVDNSLSSNELSDLITMAGLEVDSVEKVAGDFSNVIVAHVVECEDIPDTHLHKTKLDVGTGENVQVVCGAANCREGLKVAFAQVGAVLPGDFKIGKAKLRGVESFGMICSYKELGMAEESDGIIELPEDAPIGEDLRKYLNLEDETIEIELTSNRPDCLSVRGVAREVSVLLQKQFRELNVKPVNTVIADKVTCEIESFDDCPRYLCRVIKGVNQKATTPVWMTEKLRRCGIRSVSPIVDVTNYVMLELGQPLHSFDLDKIEQKIIVRRAKDGEKLKLLSEQEVTLKNDTLVIADSKGPLALAGIFGGFDSGINDNTVNVLLESAFFSPLAIKGRARAYGLNTDASHRFERGVDTEIQKRAIERATELLVEIAGGEVGPISTNQKSEVISDNEKVTLRRSRLDAILGKSIANDDVMQIFSRLGFEPQFIKGDKSQNDIFVVQAPSFRFDIAIEEDLVEEVARIYGYNNIENKSIENTLIMKDAHEANIDKRRIDDALVSLGYYEAITYSFTDPKVLSLVSKVQPLMLKDPISPEMSAMRTSLLAGLLQTAKYNLNRQQKRIRLFETGLRYIVDANAITGVAQDKMLCAIAVGDLEDESWSKKSNQVDFFDMKGDLEELISLSANSKAFEFRVTTQEYLHPGQGADIYKDGKYVGSVGMLHPKVQKELGIKQNVGVFEILYDALSTRNIPLYKEISKFPTNRRDFAFLVNKNIAASDLLKGIADVVGDKLVETRIFDIFENESLGENRSIALSVTIQDKDKTLDEAQIDECANSIINMAKDKFNATLRA